MQKGWLGTWLGNQRRHDSEGLAVQHKRARPPAVTSSADLKPPAAQEHALWAPGWQQVPGMLVAAVSATLSVPLL